MVSETNFKQRMIEKMKTFNLSQYKFVTGPGRSGAIASVYVSHYYNLTFINYKSNISDEFKSKVLVVDTAEKTGRTVRKAAKIYNNEYVTFFNGAELHHIFWYEKDFIE